MRGDMNIRFRNRFPIPLNPAFALIALLALCGRSEAAPRPNIVVILSDDYGYGSATCYGANPALIRTPNMDRLAKEGRRFTDANTTSSVCSPTRYSMLTGRYCWRTSLKHEVLGTLSPLHIEPGRINLASLLKKHGYSTASIGKWHLGYGSSRRVDYTKDLKPGPLEIGFDYHFGVPANHGDISGVYVENHRVAGLRSDKLDRAAAAKNFKGARYLGLDAPHRVDEEVMPFLTGKAVKWIEKQTEATPFFLYFTPVAIHSPVTPSKKTEGTSKAGPYGDWIHELDESVGRVLGALDRKGFTQNTLVLFTSDNGGVNKPKKPGDATDALKAGLKISGPFRGGKHDVWEGGFRVPYIVRWPGRVPAGSACDETLSLVDTLATVAALVGEPLPPKDAGAEDSYNMLPAWLAEEYKSPIRPDMILHSADGNFAIRRGQWKWIEGDYHPDTRTGAVKLRASQFEKQLYDLRADIAESADVTADHAQVANELAALLNRYRQGKYSRELPPPPPPKEPVAPLNPVSGKVVRTEKFDALPGSPWVKVRGRWTAKVGVLRGSQTAGERGPGAMRCPLKLRDADIQYELSLPLGARHSMRLQGSQKDHVFHVHVTHRYLSILRQPTEEEPTGNILMAREKLRLKPGAWAKLRIYLQADELAAQVGETVARTRHVTLSKNKPAFALLVTGRGAGFRKLVVTQPHPPK
jgi:arylsulfatase A-like enzyme